MKPRYYELDRTLLLGILADETISVEDRIIKIAAFTLGEPDPSKIPADVLKQRAMGVSLGLGWALDASEQIEALSVE
jgi:hypothetical protein